MIEGGWVALGPVEMDDAFPYIYSNGVLTGKQTTCGFPDS